MSYLIFGGLLTTPAPTAPIVGIAFIALFAIVGVMVGPDYDGMNAPALGNSKDTCLLYTSPSPRDGLLSRMPSSA